MIYGIPGKFRKNIHGRVKPMSDTKIKTAPCPYCGCKEFEGVAQVIHKPGETDMWEGKFYYWVKCKKCKMTSPPKRRKLEALKAHNKRA